MTNISMIHFSNRNAAIFHKLNIYIEIVKEKPC